MIRLLTGAAMTLVVLVALASPAQAHASLESTVPPAGTALLESPEQVVLRFNEHVEATIGGLRLFGGGGERLDDGSVSRPDGKAEAVALSVPNLDEGAYVVTWRVVSADGHPVQGAFTFRVGSAPADGETQALAERLLGAEDGSALVGALYGLTRMLVFASLVVLVGGVAFLMAVWPVGAGHTRVRGLLWMSWVGAVVSTAAGVVLHGPYVAGLPLGDALDPSGVFAALDSRFGQIWVARLVLLALAAPLLVTLLAQRRPAQWLPPAAALVGAGLLVTPGLSGHAATGDLVPLAVAADLAHLGAVSVWLGGLALLCAAVLPRRDPAELAEVVPRFSKLAFAAVVAIVVTGSFQSWRQVGSFEALTSTTYGKLLMTKLALFAALVALGALSRTWVRHRYQAPALALSVGPGAVAADTDADPVGRLRKSVAAEVGVGAAVLALSALLVNAAPASGALAQPFSTELRTEKVLIDLTLDPAKAGRTDLHLYTLTTGGTVTDVEEITAELRLPSHEIGPLEVPLEPAGPGHFAAYAFDLPIPGQWEVTVAARLSEFDQVEASTTVPVR